MPDLQTLLLQFMNGLTFAGLLFVLASGFTLVFGLMRIVNMAHGAFYILGAYVAYSVSRSQGSWTEGLVAATIVVGVLAVVCYALIRRVSGDLPQTLLTLGIGTVVADLTLAIWGGNPKSINAPAAISSPLILGNFVYPGYRAFVLVVACLLGLGLWYLLQRTQLGRIIRAGVDNRDMVSALGINIERVFAQTFLLGGLITGFAGALGGTFMGFGPGTDLTILTYSLVVVIIGGMGSVPGTALGALIVGIVDSFGRSYFSELAIFLLSGTLVAVLAFRPQGIFGKEAK